MGIANALELAPSPEGPRGRSSQRPLPKFEASPLAAAEFRVEELGQHREGVDGMRKAVKRRRPVIGRPASQLVAAPKLAPRGHERRRERCEVEPRQARTDFEHFAQELVRDGAELGRGQAQAVEVAPQRLLLQARVLRQKLNLECDWRMPYTKAQGF